MSKSPLRHNVLVRSGWRYDQDHDRYARPGSVCDGTECWYNLEAAWAMHQMKTHDPRHLDNRPDDRHKEPL